MATQSTPLPLLLTKGAFGSLPEGTINGRLAIELEDISTNLRRARLSIDDNDKRYIFRPLWGEIIDAPEFVLKEDGTAINLGIAASTTTGAPKVQLLYNIITESLDFMFT